MSLRRSRAYRATLIVLSLGCLAAAGYVAYLAYFAPASTARKLRDAEAAYARGAAAYELQKWGDAATRFDEAKLLCDNAIASLEKQAGGGKMTPDEVKALLGRIMWAKARAVRDREYAKARAAGAPLPDITDPQYKEVYRAPVFIPGLEERVEVFTALRVAAASLPTDRDVIKDALRTELARIPIEWNFAEPQLRAALALDPKDARTLFYLAKFEYDQPGENNLPTRSDKKAGDRVEKARAHLTAARENGAGAWRTIGLDAEMRRWELRTAAARKMRPAAVAAAEAALDKILFEPPTEAIDMVGRADKIATINRVDMDGILYLIGAGIDRGLAFARKADGSPDRIRQVVRAALDVANAASGSPLAGEIAAGVIEALSEAQPYLSQADTGAWRDAVSGMDALVKKVGAAAEGRPQVQLRLAQITFRDSLLADRQGDPTLAKALAEQALKQLDAGLKLHQSLAPGLPADEFHLGLAEWKLLGGGRGDEVKPHLDKLRASTNPRMKLYAQFMDGVVAERQGRFDAARQLLRPVTIDRTHTDLAFRANLLMASIALAAGDPSSALTALRDAEPMYARLDELPATERAWATEYIRSRDEVTAMQVTATLDVALQSAGRFRRDNPGKPIPSDLLAPHEANVERALKKITRPSDADRTARLAVAGFLSLTGRPKVAEARLAELALDYPSSIQVLRARVALLAVPENPTAPTPDPNGVAAGDVLVEKFLKDYPADRTAKLFKAEWLVRTARADRAVEYLRAKETFPGGRDDAVDRVLAASLIQAGLREEARSVLARLPEDPAVAAVLIRSAATQQVAESKIKDSLARYENKGLFQVYQGSLLLSQKKFAEATSEFAAALAVSQVRPAARAGLQWALIAHAAADPTAARESAVRLAGEMPDESALYLATALAALRLEDIGNITDNWDQTKTMYAAVNRWEQAATKGGLGKADAAVAKVQFRALGGDLDGARRDAVVVLTQNPKHVPTMILLADLYLASPVDLPRAREYHQMAAKEHAADPRLPYLDARIRQADGDWAGAAAAYDKVVAESPRNPTPYPPLIATLVAAGKDKVALERTREWRTRLPDDDRATVTLVYLLALTGDKAGANKLADDFVAAQTAEAKKRGGDEAAEKAKLNALMEVSSAFFRGRALDDSAARAAEVLKVRPADERGILMIGDVAVERSEWDAATAAYRDLLKLNPRHMIAGNNLAWILAEKKNDAAGALELVDRIRKGPDGTRPISPERLPPDFLDTLGVVYLKLNQPARAREMVAVFDAAAKRHPTDPRMLLYLGHAYRMAGERSRAVDTFQAAVRLAATRNGLKDQQNKEVRDAAEDALKKFKG